MDLYQILNNQSLINLFFRLFAYVFSIIYLLFTIVIYNQTRVMNKSLITNKGKIILFISFVHILFALVIVLLAFLFI